MYLYNVCMDDLMYACTQGSTYLADLLSQTL